MLNNLLLGQTAEEKLYVEDVFSTWLYTGNGSTQTITNGIDLAGKGGLVWLKARTGGNLDHVLYDTARTTNARLITNTTAAQTTQYPEFTSFNSNGFSFYNNIDGGYINQNGVLHASWTFRKAPKFFDIVTYVGNGTSQSIPHNLGSVPGMIVVKKTSTAGSWSVYHRSIGAGQTLSLSETLAAGATTTFWNNTTPTATVFSLGANSTTNQNGVSYVAYLFAHDTTADGIVQCGSFTTDSSGNATVSLGWEPQFGIFKNSGAASNWLMFDTMRGAPVDGNGLYLQPNTASAEAAIGAGVGYLCPTSTGFQVKGLGGVATIIYLAIRRGPMRVPTDATKVFSAITSSSAAGTVLTTSFPIDTQIAFYRPGDTNNAAVADRLRKVSTNSTDAFASLFMTSTNAESTTSPGASTRNWNNTGFSIPAYHGGASMVYWNFRRAPGFFDVTCYSGTGSARTVSHNLGVAPELMIIKSRSVTYGWPVYAASVGATQFAYLDQANTFSVNNTAWNNTTPTASVFTVGSGPLMNASGQTFVAYLFASCPGVSKVGSYTGNGSSLNIDCGFTNGARFVLIKRTDSTGSWYVWDTARGIVTANDPYVIFDSTAGQGEVTTNDSIDPLSSGFTVNQNATTNVNVNAATYIYLAIA